MDVGVIGMGENGQIVAAQILGKTAHNLYVYDPDGRSCEKQAVVCTTAAELCERCGVAVIALESASDLTALCNGIARFIQPDQIFIDLTDTSPALAHAIANGIRRRDARYLDCGIFGCHGLSDRFILFAGGSSKVFAEVLPLIRCFAPDCRYMGPSGRGKAVRLFCRALAAQLQHSVNECTALAESFGIDGDHFMESLDAFEQIVNPLAALGGGVPNMRLSELREDAAVAAEMARRAHLELDGLFAAEK